jgi:hypothetical protein
VVKYHCNIAKFVELFGRLKHFSSVSELIFTGLKFKDFRNLKLFFKLFFLKIFILILIKVFLKFSIKKTFFEYSNEPIMYLYIYLILFCDIKLAEMSGLQMNFIIFVT